jgi:hypothetical protein
MGFGIVLLFKQMGKKVTKAKNNSSGVALPSSDPEVVKGTRLLIVITVYLVVISILIGLVGNFMVSYIPAEAGLAGIVIILLYYLPLFLLGFILTIIGFFKSLSYYNKTRNKRFYSFYDSVRASDNNSGYFISLIPINSVPTSSTSSHKDFHQCLSHIKFKGLWDSELV